MMPHKNQVMVFKQINPTQFNNQFQQPVNKIYDSPKPAFNKSKSVQPTRAKSKYKKRDNFKKKIQELILENQALKN